MDKSPEIISLIRAKGPLLPVVVAKELKTDIILASAFLSTMVSRKEVKFSHLRVGGSPLYYLYGQEARLQNFADKLNAPDRRAYDLLKEKKVLRESELEPLQRVSLKRLRDFAVPLNVRLENQIEVFWKWYLLIDNEAEAIIKRQLNIEEPLRKEEKTAPVPAEKREVAAARQVNETKEIIMEEKKHLEQIPLIKKEEERKGSVPEKIKRQERLSEDYSSGHFREGTSEDSRGRFFKEIANYFSKQGISIIETSIVKKESEIDFIVNVPSAIGTLVYYCKAKSKKTSNDTDLASALVQAQARKLPALYLTKGELTKKAREMLEKEFKAIAFRKF